MERSLPNAELLEALNKKASQGLNVRSVRGNGIVSACMVNFAIFREKKDDTKLGLENDVLSVSPKFLLLLVRPSL